jgi:phage repressor protein C with HTH and peptisase S24 domain
MDVDWFKARKKEAGVTDAALADVLGIERSVANKVANGRVTINARKIGAVANLLKVTTEEMMFRAGLSSDPPPATSPSGTQPEAGHRGDRPEQPRTRSADAGETAPVTRLDLSYSMGPGRDLDASYIDGEAFEFDLAFLRSMTITPPQRIRIVDGIGDSMSPTLHDRDLLFIDINQATLNAQDRIWAIWLFGLGAVKRLRALDAEKVLVISDNPDMENQTVNRSDIIIHGRVVGSIKRH